MATAFVTVLELPVPAITSNKPAYCVGEKVTLTAGGGKDYSWLGPSGAQLYGSPASFTMSHAGMGGLYTVTATDARGCVGQAIHEIAVIPGPRGEFSGKLEGCVPFCEKYTLQEQIVADWRLTEIGGSATQLAAKHTGELPWCFNRKGLYELTALMTDQNTNCRATATYTINVFEKPKADFTWLPEKPVAGIEEVLLLNNSAGSEQRQWNWYMEHDRSFRPTTENAEYFFSNEGKYPIVFVVENKWNCADTIIKVLEIESDFAFYMPNAFTPNADSRNEVFKPVVQGIRKYHFQVFDRWGERVFVTEDLEEGWDGTFRGQPCKQDSYVWKVVVTTNNGMIEERGGSVIILR